MHMLDHASLPFRPALACMPMLHGSAPGSDAPSGLRSASASRSESKSSLEKLIRGHGPRSCGFPPGGDTVGFSSWFVGNKSMVSWHHVLPECLRDL